MDSSTAWRGVTNELLAGPLVSWVPEWPLIRNPCNMEPAAYHQPIIYFVVVLADHYSLSFPKMVGLQTAFEHLPHTTIYFQMTAMTLLTHVGPTDLPEAFRGYGFGLLMVLLMEDYKTLEAKQPRQPGKAFFRFPNYITQRVQERMVWFTQCPFKTSLLLHCWSVYGTSPSKSAHKKIYTQVYDRLAFFSPNSGTLIIGHLIVILSELGLLPHWFREFAVIDKKSKYMKYFLEKFPTNQTMWAADPQP